MSNHSRAAEPLAVAPHVVVMGVAGCGKTTIGSRLARDLGVPFVDGDDLHSAENIAKMSARIPLTDDDRAPWLASVGEVIRDAESGVVVACSALARRYRDRIRDAAPETVFVHLAVDRARLAERIDARPDHFMSVELLDSQLAVLEPLGGGEIGVQIDATRTPAAISEELRSVNAWHRMIGATT